jgi:SAM-dependent methyltransferase
MARNRSSHASLGELTMAQSLKKYAQRSLNSVLGVAGMEIVRSHRWDEPRTFIPLNETLEGAKKAGLSVGDYIDHTYNVPGATQTTIDQLVALGVFTGKIERVCEIGPGSGRYLEKVLKVCQPTYYEVYETASNWARWLAQTYPVVLQPTDGMSLGATPSESIDLMHAHKVFGTLPFLVTMRYFLEMARVVRTGGRLVFDIMTEECMDDPMLEKWIGSGMVYSTYPAVMPEAYTLDFFRKRGFELDGEFFIPNLPGKTKYFVFSKR